MYKQGLGLRTVTKARVKTPMGFAVDNEDPGTCTHAMQEGDLFGTEFTLCGREVRSEEKGWFVEANPNWVDCKRCLKSLEKRERNL